MLRKAAIVCRYRVRAGEIQTREVSRGGNRAREYLLLGTRPRRACEGREKGEERARGGGLQSNHRLNTSAKMNDNPVEAVYREWISVDVVRKAQGESNASKSATAEEDKDVDEYRAAGTCVDRPVGRGGHAIAHFNDEHGDQVKQMSPSSPALSRCTYLLIGGADRSGTAFGDVWELQCSFAEVSSSAQGSHRATDTWTWTRCVDAQGKELNIPPRSGASAVVMGTRVIVFGGQDPVSGSCFNDTIILERIIGEGRLSSAWTWRRSMPTDSSPTPPARHSHVCTRASSRLMALFGGASHTHGLLGDLWIFDADTESWVHRRADGISPQAREMAAAVTIRLSSSATAESSVDEHEHGGLLMHGGRGDTGVLADAYILRFRDWRWQRLAAAVGSPQLEGPGTGEALGGANQSRCAHCAVRIGASRALFCGGFDGAGVTGKAFLIDVDERDPDAIDDESCSHAKDAVGGRSSICTIVDSIRNEDTAARFASAAVALRAPPERIVDVDVQTTHVCLVGGVTAEADLADVLLLLG